MRPNRADLFLLFINVPAGDALDLDFQKFFYIFNTDLFFKLAGERFKTVIDALDNRLVTGFFLDLFIDPFFNKDLFQ